MPTFISDFRRSSFVPAAIGMMLVTTDAGAQLVDPDSQNAAQLSMGEATLAMCPTLGLRRANPDITQSTGEANLNDFCDALAGGDFSNTNAVLQRVNGEELQSPHSWIAGDQFNSVMTRMTAVALGADAGRGIDVSGLSIGAGNGTLFGSPGEDRLTDDGLLGDVDWERLGLFIRGSILVGDQDPTGAADGFDFTSDDVTVGLDYRLTDRVTVGAALGYNRYDVDFDVTENSVIGQDLKSDGYLVSAFVTYTPTTKLFLSAIVNAGQNTIKSTRRVEAVSTDPEVESVDAVFKSTFDAIKYGGAVTAIYDAASIAGFLITPTARFEYAAFDIDGATERDLDDSDINLRFGSQKDESLTAQLGLEISRSFVTPIGTFVPSARITDVREFLGQADGVKVQYAEDPTSLSEFNVATPERDRHFTGLGANLALTLENGVVLYADYGTIKGLSGREIEGVTIGVQTSLGAP